MQSSPPKLKGRRRRDEETRPWPSTPRAEPAISFGGPVIAEGKSNFCYMVGMADDKDPVEKALMAWPLATITSQDNVNSRLVTIYGEYRSVRSLL